MAIVTPTLVSDYTWANADFSWDSVTAQVKSWDGASIYDYDMTELVSLVMAESSARNFTLETFLESLNITDSIEKNVLLGIQRSLAFAETYLDFIDFNLTVNENLNIVEVLGKSIILDTFAESFIVAESYANSVGLNKSEAVAFAELYADSILFYMLAEESFGISDSLAKDATLTVEETLAIVERYIRTSDMAVGDLTIKNVALDEASFATAQGSAPVGFGTFEDFYPGQYNFNEALFKTILRGAASADRPRITELTVNVDIPEIGDRGTETLTAALLTVTMNKEFYTPPEIGIVHKGGTIVAVPRVSNITTTTFDVTLEKASDGSLVAGDISWTAYGS